MVGLGLFTRMVRVEIGVPNTIGVRLADLRVGFRVEHKASKTVSTATVQVYNPAPASIARLHIPLSEVRLLVGYEPTCKLIFQGVPVKDGIDLRVNGPDRVLVVDLADGGRGYTEAFIQTSFATSTTFGQVLSTVLLQTLWTRGFIDPALEAVVLPHGIVLTDSPSEVMDRLAASVPPFGADWFIRDNALYVVAKGKATLEKMILISSTQGNLIGSPNGTKKGVKVKALIDATMRPGMSFGIESVGLSGAYVCKEVTFNGDSGYENPYYMDITGKALGVP